ncbi:hypothetical protein OAS39_07980 [Pirellulales bacterium]|nr:hypothetical protein [Pirellulales bacterium]
MTQTLENTQFFQTLSVKARRLYVYICVDCSGSMAGDPLAQANFGGREFASKVSKIQEKYPNIKVLIKLVAWSDAVTWVTRRWMEADKFQWTDIASNGGTTFANVCDELRRDMDPENLGTSGLQPHIIMLMDGKPTDDYKSSLRQLVTSKPWGTASIRSAVACGQADVEMLRNWIGDSGGVLAEVNDAGDLAKTLAVIALSAVEFGSSAPSEVNGTPKELQEFFDEKMEENNGIADLLD